MSRFRYAGDPLCLGAIGLYVVVRFGLRPHLAAGGFWHDQFTDLLLIPAALPLLLWVHRRLGLRPNDRPPTWAEIGLHCAVWSVAAEVITPALSRTATGDWRDIAAYVAGAALAGGWWTLAA